MKEIRLLAAFWPVRYFCYPAPGLSPLENRMAFVDIKIVRNHVNYGFMI